MKLAALGVFVLSVLAACASTEESDVLAPEEQFARAESRFADGDYRDAIADYQTFTFNYPQDARVVEARWKIAQGYYELEDWATAAQEYLNFQRDHAADPRAAEAVEAFCYQLRKYVGAYAAVLGGLDALVFTAGIGEHSATVRARTCEGLQFLGVRLDLDRNARHAPVISPDDAPVTVRVIPTDEDVMIARHTRATLT